MTDLTKPIRRRTMGQFMHYKKRIVVIIEPDDVIGMHLERSRTIYRAPISKLYATLAQWHADGERWAKGKGRERESVKA